MTSTINIALNLFTKFIASDLIKINRKLYIIKKYLLCHKELYAYHIMEGHNYHGILKFPHHGGGLLLNLGFSFSAM